MADRVHNFTQFPQSYNYGCWLASTHSLNMYEMYGGYYTGLPYPVLLWDYNSVNFNNSWLGENQGILMDTNVLSAFASENNLHWEQLNGNTSVIKNKIGQSPVMVAGNIVGVGIHFFTIYGVKGETIYYADPMPVSYGSRGVTTFSAFKQKHPNAFKHAFWKI